jgi:hypothetical protein
MSNLIQLSGNQVQKYDDKAFEATSTSANYLPRISLQTSQSKKCKSGEFPINSYAQISGQLYFDLGKEVDVLVIAWRPKALEMGENVISVYDHTDPEFARISEKSEIKDSGCQYGPEFLLWIPKTKKFATFFMGSKSSRREAPALKNLLQAAATLKSKHIETKKYDWYAPSITPCNTPFELPPMEEIMKEVEKFNNPPKSEIEKAEPDQRER